MGARVLSSAALQICDVAVVHLAERGYDGCSLNEIADLAGMRKASLYSHFAGKDDLVRTVLDLALDRERAALRQAFAEDPGTPRGAEYLRRTTDRVATSPDLRFLLRTAYAPPHSIRDDVVTLYRSLNEDLRTLFADGLPSGVDAGRARTATEAYLGAVDGVQVEVLYGDPAVSSDRGQALWAVVSQYVDAS